MACHTYTLKYSMKQRPNRSCYIILIIAYIVAIILLSSGIVLLRNMPSCKKDNIMTVKRSTSSIKGLHEYCELSTEAKRINLQGFLQKYLNLYFLIYPHEELMYMKDSSQKTLNEIARR